MNTYDDYLAHHGILGQKWGVRRTPEELGHKPPSKRKKAKQAKEEARKKERAERAAKKSLEDKENLKEYLRKHPKKLPKYSRELTREEAAEIISNIEFDKRLKDIRQSEIDRGWDKVRSISNKMRTIGELANNAKSLYNSYVEINNTLIDTGVYSTGKKMTKLGERPEDSTKKAMDKLVQTAPLDEVLAKSASLTTDQLQTAANRYNSISTLERAAKDKSSSYDSYEALRSLSKDDFMKVMDSKSESQLNKEASRINTAKKMYENLHPEENQGKGKGNNVSVDDIIDELKNRGIIKE